MKEVVEGRRRVDLIADRDRINRTMGGKEDREVGKT